MRKDVPGARERLFTVSTREMTDVRTGRMGDGMRARPALVALFALAFVHSTFSLIGSIQVVLLIDEGWDFLGINAISVIMACVCIWLLVKSHPKWVWVGLGFCIAVVAQFALMTTASDTLDPLTIARRLFVDMPKLELQRGSKARFLRLVFALYALLPFSVGFIAYFSWQAIVRAIGRCPQK